MILLVTGVTLAAFGAVAGASVATERTGPPFLKTLGKPRQVSSTVPLNGDVNPYGVAIVPDTIGTLVKGDTLVSNFNDKANVQGTGTTIMEVSPSGADAHVCNNRTAARVRYLSRRDRPYHGTVHPPGRLGRRREPSDGSRRQAPIGEPGGLPDCAQQDGWYGGDLVQHEHQRSVGYDLTGDALGRRSLRGQRIEQIGRCPYDSTGRSLHRCQDRCFHCRRADATDAQLDSHWIPLRVAGEQGRPYPIANGRGARQKWHALCGGNREQPYNEDS